MSNHLAIATVTAALGHIVHSAAEASGVGSVGLEFGRPTVSGDGQTMRKVQLYLYQVSPNAALRNADLPTRGSGGNLVQRPQVALSLHYLLAFYGGQQALEPERMLGAVARDLNARPLLSRQAIQNAISSYPDELNGTNLADAVERVRFTPEVMSLDELSKLWSVFFQTPHALSIIYQADVVLIDAEETGPTALPVIERGEGDWGIDAVPEARTPFPILAEYHIGVEADAVAEPRPKSFPAAQLGALLILTGSNLAGDTVAVEFKHARFSEPDHPQFLAPITLTVPPADRTATEVRVAIPNDVEAQTTWRAGSNTVSVIVTSGGITHRSNAASLDLVPRITSISPSNPISRDEEGDVTIELTTSPLVSVTQKAMLLLANRAITAQPRTSDMDPLQFVISDAPVVEDAVVQLRVDDWTSIPFERRPTPPGFRFANSQKVTIT